MRKVALRCAGKDSAQPHADGKQTGGLAVNQLKVFVDGDGLTEAFNLQQFAFDHGLGQLNQGVEDVEIALLYSNLEGLHVEPVSGENALGIAPLGVGRRATAPCLSLVDDVVVHEGGGVDDFHNGAQLDRSLAGIIHQLAGK